MILWVVIYSYLPANNFFTTTGAFVNEVEILFGNLTFWGSVIFSVLVALGEVPLPFVVLGTDGMCHSTTLHL